MTSACAFVGSNLFVPVIVTEILEYPSDIGKRERKTERKEKGRRFRQADLGRS